MILTWLSPFHLVYNLYKSEINGVDVKNYARKKGRRRLEKLENT